MKCQQATCDSDAAWAVFWPGQTLVMCDHCFGQRIADAMGFTLRGERLPEPEKPGGLDESGRPFLEID